MITKLICSYIVFPFPNHIKIRISPLQIAYRWEQIKFPCKIHLNSYSGTIFVREKINNNNNFGAQLKIRKLFPQNFQEKLENSTTYISSQ